MPPIEGEAVEDFEALLCDGRTFRSARLSEMLGPRGGVVVCTGFAFSAIAQNWWKHFVRSGWEEFEGVAVVGVSRDGPYAQNEFLDWLGDPDFRMVADVNGGAAVALDLLEDRHHMANVSTPRRAAVVLDPDREIQYAHVAEDWISPLPDDEIEAAIGAL